MKVGRGVFKAFDSRVISLKHGYQSRVQVGRGSDKKGYLSNWVDAVTQTTARKRQKS